MFGEVDGGQGSSWGEVHGEVVAVMEIASERPIVSGLSGRSNLGSRGCLAPCAILSYLVEERVLLHAHVWPLFSCAVG